MNIRNLTLITVCLTITQQTFPMLRVIRTSLYSRAQVLARRIPHMTISSKVTPATTDADPSSAHQQLAALTSMLDKDLGTHQAILSNLIAQTNVDLASSCFKEFWQEAAHSNPERMLHHAIILDSYKAVAQLVKAGARLNYKNTYAAVPNSKMLIQIIKLGAPVNADQDNEAHTPLIRAIQEKHTLSTALLLCHGANPNQGISEVNPFVLAVEEDNEQLLAALIRAGMKFTTPRNPAALHIALDRRRIANNMTYALSKYMESATK